MNQQRPLKDEPILSTDEFATAILAAVHDTTPEGRARQLSIARAAQALQAVNPLQMLIEDVTLWESDTSPAGTEYRTEHFLDLKQRSVRHNFTDNYFAFTFFFGLRTISEPNPDKMIFESQIFCTKDVFFESETEKGITIEGVTSTSRGIIWKASNTSFFSTNSIRKIVGHRLTLSLKTPA